MPKEHATNALVGYMNTQIDRVRAGDAGLRRGHDPVHDTRVAIRRLRSTLRVFDELFDRAAIGDMDDELKWFAGLLGEVRDCQVQLGRFKRTVDELPGTLVLGPVKSRIRNDLKAVERPARARVVKAMESERYHTLMSTLLDWRAKPPVLQPIQATALREPANRAERKAARRLSAALETGSDEKLHSARKAAKRARYAAELRKPVDKSAKKTVKRYKQIQSVLGDHQDAVVATGVLRRMAISAGTTPGENGFTFGLLYAREQQVAARSRTALRRL